MMLGCKPWWFMWGVSRVLRFSPFVIVLVILWVLLVGRFCGLFLDVALVFGGFFRLALVSPMYTTRVLRGSLRFFSQ
jgi:hypothetical protein